MWFNVVCCNTGTISQFIDATDVVQMQADLKFTPSSNMRSSYFGMNPANTKTSLLVISFSSMAHLVSS